MNIVRKSFFAFLFGVGIGGCVKEDYSKLKDTVVWTPNVSLPIGVLENKVPLIDKGSDWTVLENPSAFYEMPQDTIKFNFSDLSDTRKQVKRLMFRFFITNGFPSQAKVTVDYYDAEFQFLGSLTKNGSIHIPKPAVNPVSGNINSVSVTEDVWMAEEDIDVFIEARNMIVRVVLSAFDMSDKIVEKMETYAITSKVAVRAEVVVDTEEGSED